jgi:alkylated DNA repair dioxygenase AlkB
MQRLDMPEAEVYRFEYDLRLFGELRDEIEWRQDTIRMYGREYNVPRLTAWYGDPEATYLYSGIRNKPLPWTDLLSQIRRDVENIVDASFNSVLLNYYRNGRDSIGFHSDDEPELGPYIASVSFGCPRTLIFRHKKALYPDVRVEQHNGTGLLMTGDTQKNWQHGINKDKGTGARISLTFRQIKCN